MRKQLTMYVLMISILVFPLIAFAENCCGNHETGPHNMMAVSKATKAPASVNLPEPGKKVQLTKDIYFTWEFAKKPKIGPNVIKISLFDKTGKANDGLSIIGDFDMPSMRGMHSSGKIEFKKNNKGAYLMPINIVMLGEWEIQLMLKGTNIPSYNGVYTFKVK